MKWNSTEDTLPPADMWVLILRNNGRLDVAQHSPQVWGLEHPDSIWHLSCRCCIAASSTVRGWCYLPHDLLHENQNSGKAKDEK